MFKLPVPKTMITLMTLLLVVGFTSTASHVTAQTPPCLAWVQDHNILDSQFGFYEGTTANYVVGIYRGLDIEGLAYIQNTLYAASGGDGLLLAAQ